MIYSLQTFGKHTENDKSNCTNILMQMNFQQKNSAILIMISCLKPWIQLKKMIIPFKNLSGQPTKKCMDFDHFVL